MKVGVIGRGIVGEAVYQALQFKKHIMSFYDIKYKDSKIEDVLDTECIFVCVPTPVDNATDKCDTSILYSVIEKLNNLKYTGLIAIKSTIIPGTTDKLIKDFPNLKICFVPEFLKERSALHDFLYENHICIIGTYRDEDVDLIKKVMLDMPKYYKKVTPIEAELTKYFQNVFNTLKIIFANGFYEICQKNDVNYESIIESLSLRNEIDKKYLLCNPKLRGPSGPCLVKDSLAFNEYVKSLKLKVKPKIFQAIVDDMCLYPKTVIEGTRTEKEYFGTTVTKKRRILITGSHGFIAGYLIPKLLEQGHIVYGIDNFWKYGYLKKSYDDHPNFHFIEGDASDKQLLRRIIFENSIEIIVAAAALIGGITMFHEIPYDIISRNSLLTCSIFDVAVEAYQKSNFFEKIVAISSSMVFENAFQFPTPEGHQKNCPPPSSSYGFQKLSVEYFAEAAHEQYGLPYVIIRPFNAVGIGERKAKIEKEVVSGNIKLSMSHVVPDLVQKILKGQYPLRILGKGNQVRHYTYAGDIADGIYECIVNPAALNNDFNISTEKGYTVLELAKIIWNKINPEKEFKYICDEPYKYDVQMRVPDIRKSKEILGIECKTTLEQVLDEVIPWIKEQIKLGNI